MHFQLREFLNRRCDVTPAATVPLKQLVEAFRQSLPPRSQADWTRQRVLTELACAGFKIGQLERTAHVAGIGLRGEWREVGGKLELVA